MRVPPALATDRHWREWQTCGTPWQPARWRQRLTKETAGQGGCGKRLANPWQCRGVALAAWSITLIADGVGLASPSTESPDATIRASGYEAPDLTAGPRALPIASPPTVMVWVPALSRIGKALRPVSASSPPSGSGSDVPRLGVERRWREERHGGSKIVSASRTRSFGAICRVRSPPSCVCSRGSYDPSSATPFVAAGRSNDV